MDPQAAAGRDADAEVAAYLRQHPGLRGKAGPGLVTDILGPTDWVSGPGDDAAAIPCPAGSGQAFVLAAGDAERYLAEGQFPAGSVGPKITAAVRFLRGGGRLAIVTSAGHAAGALAGTQGTRIISGTGDRNGETAR